MCQTNYLSLILRCFVLIVCIAPYALLADQQAELPAEPEDPIALISELFIEQDQQIELLRNQIEEMQSLGAQGVQVSSTNAELLARSHEQKERNRMISVITICVIGALSLFASLHYATKICLSSPDRVGRRYDLMNIIALHLIVFGTLLLVLSANETDQLTAAAGILGALAGYVFRGLNEQKDAAPTPQETNTDTGS